MPAFTLVSLGKNFEYVCLEANSYLLLCLLICINIDKMKYGFEQFPIWSLCLVSTANEDILGTQLKKKNIKNFFSSRFLHELCSLASSSLLTYTCGNISVCKYKHLPISIYEDQDKWHIFSLQSHNTEM